MVFAEFRNLFDKIIVPDKVGVEDVVDRLTLFTAVLFALASLLVCMKQYIMSALNCYIPVGPSGELFRDFVNSYCWVHGTIPLKPHEPFPKSEEMWDEYDRIRRISKLYHCLLDDRVWCKLPSHLVVLSRREILCFANTKISTGQFLDSIERPTIDNSRSPSSPHSLTTHALTEGSTIVTMLATDFMDLISTVTLSDRFRLEDFADRLHLVTVVLFSLAASIIGLKQYVFNPLSCYIAIGPSGDEFADYVHSYCWVHGTIPLKAGEPIPDTPGEWEQYDRLRRV
ncbi:hypothetical protein X801_07190, partial [Opisthorchis viverrini]